MTNSYPTPSKQLLNYVKITRTGEHHLAGKTIYAIKGCVAIINKESGIIKLIDQLSFELDYARINLNCCVEDNLFSHMSKHPRNPIAVIS